MSRPPVLVLVEPQDVVNLASAVRIAKNFALEDLRVVRPLPGVYDPYRIEGIAHNTGDLVARIRRCESLEEAIQDCVFVVGLTARERAAKRRTLYPREASDQLASRSSEGPVAMVFGREDRGLTNQELDCCQALATIATNPAYRSLNLAQAVAILSYECWNAAMENPPRKGPRRPAGGASSGELQRLFHDWARTLWAIDFFKARNVENVMRSLREAIFRAELDAREAKLLRAVALEVVNFLERKRVAYHVPAELRRPGGAEPADA